MTRVQLDLAEFVKTLTPAIKRNSSGPKRFSKAQLRDLRSATHWNADGNVIGFGVGPKRTAGKTDRGTACLIVFVVKKLARSRVSKKCLVPKRIDARSVECRFHTDVIEVGSFPQLQVSTSLGPGVNAAHFSMRAGSVTAVVASRGVPKLPFLLSCCHVFAPTLEAGNPIESPPDVSAATFTNQVARVAAFEPLRAGGNVANRMDAALGTPFPGGPGLSNNMPGFGRIVSASGLSSGQFLPAGIRRIIGVGAVTPQVQGDLLAENVVTALADEFGRRFLFQDVVAYMPTPVTQAGDSGMPIMRSTPSGLELLGMHIGVGQIVNTNVRAAFFVPIAPVLNRFAVNLIV